MSAQLKTGLNPIAAARGETCPQCGYDLTGLELPHHCPECGQLVDPPADHERAVAWFSSWRGLVFGKPPPHAARYLHDLRCRRLARERLISWLLLPMIGAAVLVLAFNGLVNVSVIRFTWFFPANPEQTIDEYDVTREDRVFNLNLHLFEGPGFLGYTPRKGAANRVQLLSRSVKYAWPNPDRLACVALLLPATGLPGLLAAALALRAAVKSCARRHGAARGVLPLMSPAVTNQAVLLTLLILFDALWAASLLISDALVIAAWAALAAASVCATLGAGAAFVRSLRTCRPRRAGFTIFTLIIAAICMAAIQPLVAFLLFSTLLR